MHLLVLSAFRPQAEAVEECELRESQCTFWCSVLSDRGSATSHVAHAHVSMHLLVLSAFRPRLAFRNILAVVSQCTFWCSVLSDMMSLVLFAMSFSSLNAPFGAQCFPTRKP